MIKGCASDLLTALGFFLAAALLFSFMRAEPFRGGGGGGGGGRGGGGMGGGGMGGVGMGGRTYGGYGGYGGEFGGGDDWGVAPVQTWYNAPVQMCASDDDCLSRRCTPRGVCL
jgi:hypothetical protein